MPKHKEHPEYITEEQLELLVNKLKSSKDKLLARLLFYTGARISELLSLKSEDIDLDNRTVKLPALKRSRVIKKKKKVIGPKPPAFKYVSLPESKLEYFKIAKQIGRPNVFSITRQQAYNRIHQAGLITKIGNIYPHLLRDSYATLWALRGGDIPKLSRNLGHTTVEMTMNRYLHFKTSDIKEEVDKVFP